MQTAPRHRHVSSQLKSLQILRFVAAASVVHHHIFGSYNFGSFGVDIFFVLSGFVIALVVSSTASAKVFAINRLTRIVPLYWLLTSLLFLLAFLKPASLQVTIAETATIGNYLKSLFFIPYLSWGQLRPLLRLGWTLNYEMFFYVCVGFSLLLAGRHALKATFAMLLAAYFVLGHQLESKVAHLFFGSTLLFEFALGTLAYKIYASGQLKLSPKIFAALCAAAFAYLIYAEIAALTTARILIFGIPSFILVLCAVKLEPLVVASNSRLISAFCKMGDASYATYLTHWYVIVALRKIADEKLGILDITSPVGIAMALGFTLLIGQLVYEYIDKPLHEGLKRYFLKRIHKKNTITALKKL